MASERWHAAVTALVALLRAEAAAGRLALDGAQVFDGPTATVNADTEWIIIGASWNPDDTASGSFSQEWASDGGTNAMRRGSSQITCGLNAWSGDAEDFPTVRARAFGLLAGIEAAVRADYALGLDNVLWVEVAAGSVTQVISQGTAVFIEFTISIQSYI